MSNMLMDKSLQDRAQAVLAQMRAQGFDAAQVEISQRAMQEFNVANDEPTLLRSTQRHKLALLGLVDGRRASTEADDLGDAAIANTVAELFAAARSAPQDAANAVSAGQMLALSQGPLHADTAAMADAMVELLAFRAANAKTATLEEAFVAHHRLDAHLATSGGSALSSQLGWYDIGAMSTAREGQRCSSFNYTGGQCDSLAGQGASSRFGLGQMLTELTRQIDTRPLAAPFVGDVVLTPHALDSLLGWLRGQLSDLALISGTSLYRDKVGRQIASPLLSLRSRFDAPGVAAISADGFVTPPVQVLEAGRLNTLIPSLYASRKTGLAHVPVAATGWEVPAGATPLAGVMAGVLRGAVVGRLSMGSPAANGDFSGVIKNSFLIEGGEVGPALSDVMVSGNMAQMLRDVLAVSQERLDTGAALLPWVRVGGLHFS